MDVDPDEVDHLGRRRCRWCLGFTARNEPDGTPMHGWCRQPQAPPWPELYMARPGRGEGLTRERERTKAIAEGRHAEEYAAPQLDRQDDA
jgi:hypothetical protein